MEPHHSNLPAAPVPMTFMDNTTTAFANAQGGSTEPFWFKNNQNNPISQTSQSHQLPPVSESMLYPGDAIPYVYPGDPTPQMARPQMHHPKKSTSSHVARPKKCMSSSSVASQGLPASLPPSFSTLQHQRRRIRTPKWEMIDTPWLTCPWQHLGCPFTHKVKAQMTRHTTSCVYNPQPVLQKCDNCEAVAYTRINRLFEHYKRCTHHHSQEN
jgi:hypothetical protein